MVKTFLQFVNENNSRSILDNISDILLAISDVSPEMNTYVYEEYGDKVLLYDLDIKAIDRNELSSAGARLRDVGYELVMSSKDYNTKTWHVLIMNSDFYNKLKSKNILMYRDLKWRDWDLSRDMGVSTRHAIIDLNDGNQISVIYGKLTPDYGDRENDIKFEISYSGDDDITVAYNSCQVCVVLIRTQLKNMGMNRVNRIL